MSLPINKQPVVRPGNKMTSFGWPFHGEVVDDTSLGVGTLTLDPPASPSTKLFEAIEELVTEIPFAFQVKWYHNWNCTNTTMIQRPGWTVPVRSAGQITSDANHGHQWKSYMTFTGPHSKMSGAGSVRLKWNKWIYIDSLGAAYLISFTHTILSSTQLEFTFRIAELVVTVTRNPPERVVTGVILDTSPYFFFFSDFHKTVILDRTNTGDKLLLWRVPGGNVDLFWDQAADLPRQQSGGGISETSPPEFEILVSGNGINNIAFTVNYDPYAELVASPSFTGGPTFHEESIIGWFFDGSGVRQPIWSYDDRPVTGLGGFPIADPDHAYQWTITAIILIDWGGLYPETWTFQTVQTAFFDPPNPAALTQSHYVDGNLVDFDTHSGLAGAAYYNTTTNMFVVTPGGPPFLSTTHTEIQPFLENGGERIRRVARAYSGPLWPATVLYDLWLDKKNGIQVPSISGWVGGAAGFYEFAAYDPETGDFDAVIYAGGALPDPPASIDLKWFV